MRESTIEKKVTQFAQQHGWLSYKWCSPNNKGVPDRIYFHGGEALAIEFKAPGKTATKLQQAVHKKLTNQGFEVHVIDSIETGQALFAR